MRLKTPVVACRHQPVARERGIGFDDRGVELDSRGEGDDTDVADRRRRTQGADDLGERWLEAAGSIRERFAVEQLEIGDAGRARRGMSGVGVAVPEDGGVRVAPKRLGHAS
jgi:hypothetical protein